MNIGTAASRSGVPCKTIRYYEEIGLIPPPLRTKSGYRDFSDKDVFRLAIINRARGLGFSVADCRGLLSVLNDANRSTAEIDRLTQECINEIDGKAEQLRKLRDALQAMSGSSVDEQQVAHKSSARRGSEGPPQ